MGLISCENRGPPTQEEGREQLDWGECSPSE